MQKDCGDTKIAQKAVREIVSHDFERWTKNPNIELPIAVLSKEQAKMINSKSLVALLSSATYAKQKSHHPHGVFKCLALSD